LLTQGGQRVRAGPRTSRFLRILTHFPLALQFPLARTPWLTGSDDHRYKPVIASQIPRDFRVEFVKDSNYPRGVKGSKASGEPPLLLAYSIFGATKVATKAPRLERGGDPPRQPLTVLLRHPQAAIKASRVERGRDPCFNLSVPASVDRVQVACDVTEADLLA
jgi:xanthine dehydrogenase molybdopterin-binding subunit B